jgi:hypothetical protein
MLLILTRPSRLSNTINTDPCVAPYMIERFGYNEVAVGMAFGLLGIVYTMKAIPCDGGHQPSDD